MINKKYFDKNELIELLEKKESFDKKSKSEFNKDEISDFYNKFWRCVSYLEDQVHWTHKYSYLRLMSDFMDKKINGLDFTENFFKLHSTLYQEIDLIINSVEKIRALEVNPESRHFNDLVADILSCCDSFSDDDNDFLEEGPSVHMDEIELRQFIERFILEMERYL